MANTKVDQKTGEITVNKENVWFSLKPSRTKQSMRSDSDINKIVARGRLVGFLPPRNREPIYADVSNVPSYEDAFNRVRLAQEAFRRLPSELRDHLGHNPKNLLPFLADVKNREVAEKYGLLKPREKKQNEIQNETKKPPENLEPEKKQKSTPSA